LNFFILDLKKVIIMMLVVLPPLLFFNLQTTPDETAWYKKPFSFMTSLVQSSYADFSGSVRSTTSHYINLLDVKTENRLLKQEALELKARLLQFEELTLENDRLREYMVFAKKSKMQMIGARVIGRDPISDQITLTINRGTQHGIKEGMAVISVEGVVGYVFRPELLTSQVLIVTDRYTVIDAVVQRSRARGIVEGNTSTSCSLRYLERSDDVQVGDLIVTSGLDNIFPKGFPIGKVTSIEKEYFGTNQKVDVAPIIISSQLEEVFVILQSNNEDLTPVEELTGLPLAPEGTTTPPSTAKPVVVPKKPTPAPLSNLPPVAPPQPETKRNEESEAQ
jgi:rod shape-determining protein MreC